MMNFSNIFNFFGTPKVIKKVTAYLLLILFFYLFRDFLGIFFLTFIFAYLFLSLGSFLQSKIRILIDKFAKNSKQKKFLRYCSCLNIIIILEYIIFSGVLIFTGSDILPKLISELSELPATIPFLSKYIGVIVTSLEGIINFNTEIYGTLDQVISEKDMEVLFTVVEQIKSAGKIFIQVMVAYILSFIFIIDRFKLNKYLLQIRESNFGFLYKEYKIILEKIVLSFGLVLKAQAMIAAINALLTVLGLILIGAVFGGTFPYILTLGLIVFIFGFVPVIGVFISSVPILFVAFNFIGGYQVIVAIILLIVFVHMIEAYYLNPRIVSSFLELPISLTFIILIISEHIFGIAGLLVGVSLFYFVVSLLGDTDRYIGKRNKKS